MSEANGVAVSENRIANAEPESPKASKVSAFKRLTAFMARSGTKQKTTLTRKTEEGNVSCVLTGICLTVASAKEAAASEGTKGSSKPTAGVGAAEASASCVFVEKEAAQFVGLIVGE